MRYGTWPIRDIYFSVNLFNFSFNFHCGINVFSVGIIFPLRKKVFTPWRKVFSVEICFSPWRKVFTPRRKPFPWKKVFTPRRKLFSAEISFPPRKMSLLWGENFSLWKNVFHRGESLYSEKSLYSEEKTFFRGNMFSTVEKSQSLFRGENFFLQRN